MMANAPCYVLFVFFVEIKSIKANFDLWSKFLCRCSSIKVLSLGKAQINLAFCLLIRTLDFVVGTSARQ